MTTPVSRVSGADASGRYAPSTINPGKSLLHHSGEHDRVLGPTALAAVDQAAAVRWLGRAFGVPSELIREIPDTDSGSGDLAGLMAALGGAEVPDAAQ